MKGIRLMRIAALALPAALAAQQPAAPSASPMTAAYAGFHTRYGGNLMAAFDSIPASKYGYKPTPAQRTFGDVAAHLETANYGLCASFSGMPRMMTARDSTADSVRGTWPKDTLTARLKASFAFCDKAFATLDDAKLADQVPIGAPGSGRTAVRGSRVLIYAGDLVDHYSQIAIYMRLNGMLPPSALPRPAAR